MAERIVVNTGPLIALARAGAIDAIARLSMEFLAPMEVQRELEQGHAAGHRVVAAPCVRWVALARPPSPLAVSALDEGEAAVVQLALDEGVGVVCIDERKGRRAALAVGLRVTGTLGLLGRAKRMGVLPAVRPYVERMVGEGIRFDPALVQRFLEAVDE